MFKKTLRVINCPINKKLIKSGKIIGVTEYFMSKNGYKNHSEVMMIYTKFSVILLKHI